MKKIVLFFIIFSSIAVWAQEQFIDLMDYPLQYRFETEEKLLDWSDIEEFDIPEFYPAKTLWLQFKLPSDLPNSPLLYISNLYGEFSILNGDSLLYHYVQDNNQLNHLIKLDVKLDSLTIKFDFESKYYHFPIQTIFIVDQADVPLVLDEHGYDIMINQLPNIFGFIYLFFSIILLFLAFRISEARIPLLGFSVFTLVEGTVLLMDPLLAYYLDIPPSLFSHLNLSFIGAHNIAVLFICNLMFANGKSKVLNINLVWQLLLTIFINIWVLSNSFNEYLEIILALSILVTFISIIVIMIRNRKQVYPKISFYVGIAYILLPLISALSEWIELEEFFRYVYLIVSGLILLIFVYIALEKYKKSQAIAMDKTLSLEQKENQLLHLEKEKLLSQLNVLKNQMNPHFLFNSLSTLTALIDEDQERAIEYVEELSLVFRYVLQAGRKDLISLEEELEFLKSYSHLLSLRYHHNLTFNYDISEESLSHKLPPLTLQLMVENVVKHNIIDEDSPMEISIYTRAGKLFVKNPLQNSELKLNFKLDSIGIGQQNIQKLFDFYMKEKINFRIEENFYIVEIPLLGSE